MVEGRNPRGKSNTAVQKSWGEKKEKKNKTSELYLDQTNTRSGHRTEKIKKKRMWDVMQIVINMSNENLR